MSKLPGVLRTVFALAITTAVLLGCGGSDDNESATGYETSLDGLAEVYPLPDVAIERVRWRQHNDFLDDSRESGPVAQDANPVVEAVFTFDDDALASSLATGRATTLTDIPDWYPSELATLADGGSDVNVLVSRNVDQLKGVVYVFPDHPQFVVVQYDPLIDGG